MSVPSLISAYSPPSAALTQVPPDLKSAGEVRVEGSKLLVPDGYMFPPICVFTGATTGLERPETHQASYCPRQSIGFAIGGIVGALVARSGGVETGCYSVSVSTAAKARRRRMQILGGVVSLVGVGLLLLSFVDRGEVTYLFPIATIMMIVGFGMITSGGGKLSVLKIKNRKLYISGIPRKVRQQILEFEYRRLQTNRVAAEQQARAKAQAQAAAAAAAPPPPAGPPPLPVASGY